MRFYPLILLLFVGVSALRAMPQADTVVSRADSLRADSSVFRRDSLAAKADTAAEKSGIDTVIRYSSSDSIVFHVPKKIMSMYNQGDIRYRQMELKADRIDIDWSTSVMTAFGVPDTSDTSRTHMRGSPVMKDGAEQYDGKELGYNFKTKKGRIRVADTKMDEGFYHGEQLKRVAPNILFVADGRYTTCEQPDPHYYFSSPTMEVIFGDKVIAEPVYFSIADVPVFWLPLAVFPNKGGRRSGIIAPAIAEDATHGRLLRHLGYYFALSDYMDLTLQTDLYTKGSWALYSDYRYRLLYYFNGSISGNYKKFMTGESTDPSRTEDESYFINWTHNQEIDPTARFDVNFTFASNNSYRNTIDLNQAMNQSIYSNATLFKKLGESNSATINIQRRQNLIDGSIDETLPSLSFSHSTIYPFRSSKHSASGSGLSWYEMIGMSYSASASNRRTKSSRSIDSIKTSPGSSDTIGTVTDYEYDRNQALNQSASISIAPKVGHFTISRALSYSDNLSFADNDVPTRNPADSLLMTVKQRQRARTGNLSASISTNTRLYGIIQPDMLGIQAFRHTFTPALSFGYSKQIVGENLPEGQMSAHLGLENLFEMKLKPAEEGKEGTKIQLLNLSAGLSYNFSADSLNFSPINVSYRTGIGNYLSVDGGANFDLYKQDDITHGRINKFLLGNGGGLARMTDFRLSLSTSLSGEKNKSSHHIPSVTDTTEKQPVSGYYGLFREEEPDFSIPWRLSLSFDYSENKVQPYTSRSSNLHGTLDFNLTENWKFTVTGSYDVMNRQFLYPNMHITRDLHCWTMDVSWVPLGSYRSYQFEIRLKAPQLRDIKVTKQGSDSGIYSP